VSRPAPHHAADVALVDAAKQHILDRLARGPADRETLRSDLAVRCRGVRYIESALKVLAHDGRVVSVGRKWQLSGRVAA
jgi:predicted transcriptional regulator